MRSWYQCKNLEHAAAGRQYVVVTPLRFAESDPERQRRGYGLDRVTVAEHEARFVGRVGLDQEVEVQQVIRRLHHPVAVGRVLG